jgi:hypothetical protein
MEFSDADLAYVRGNYFTLDEVCAGRTERPDDVRGAIARQALPAPSYVLPGEVEMVPADYFVFVDQAGGLENLRVAFERRHAAAGGDPSELEADWDGYLSGIFGVCLRLVVPETMVRKEQLVKSVGRLLASPQPGDRTWRSQLRSQVWELDALEREFAPDCDRAGRFPEPPTRDRLIRAAYVRYAEVFADRE